MRDYAGGYARTTVQQNFVLRWVREETRLRRLAGAHELGLGDAGSREITDVVSCPGTDSCKLGITSSMGLNEAIQERIEAMEITDELTREPEHQDQRLPQRLRPAPRRQHRLHRRLDQGRRAHDPRLHPPRRRRLRRRRGQVRHPPEAAPALQAGPRRDRALDRPLRGQPRRGRGVERFRRAGRDRRARGAGKGPLAAGRFRTGDDEPVHRLEPRTSHSKWFAARASARSSAMAAGDEPAGARRRSRDERCNQLTVT